MLQLQNISNHFDKNKYGPITANSVRGLVMPKPFEEFAGQYPYLTVGIRARKGTFDFELIMPAVGPDVKWLHEHTVCC